MIDPVEDLPHEPQDVPLWSETYLWTAYDPARRVGFYLHQGVTAFDPRLWRSTFGCCLPNGDLLVTKSYGRPPDDRSTGAAVLHATCDVPLERWTVNIDGAARLVSRDESRARLISDGLPTKMRMQVTFDGTAPVFSPGAASWGRLHHDQPCAARGRLEYGDQAMDFDGTGYRDHSMGPRDLSGYRGSDWCEAWFPSGRFFYVTDITWDPSEHSMRRGFIFDGGTYQFVEIKSMPVLSEAAVDPSAVRLSFVGQDGPADISGEIENVIRFTHKLPHELCLGTDRDSTTSTDLAVLDCMTRYSWEGEVGFGLCEWILPMSELRKADVLRW
ncbi:MAG: hypothetical protein WEB06_07100 [Actinomycetota bacterium]